MVRALIALLSAPRLWLAIAIAALAAAAAWWLQATRYDATIARLQRDHAQVLQGIADKTAAAALAVRRYEAAVQTALAASDTTHHQELTHARAETDRLRACVRAGTCGVRIITAGAPSACDRPPDAAPGGVGDATLALDAATAQRVLDLRESVESDRIKLDYLRDYASACWQAAGALTTPGGDRRAVEKERGIDATLGVSP